MASKIERDYLILKEKHSSALKALEVETHAQTELKIENAKLTAEASKQKEAYTKLEKHAKNCEKATNKAQKEAKNAKGHADHLINSQKGQLRSAERRYEETARILKEWRDKYGWSVEKPAEEMYALQVRLTESESKAQELENEVASLEEQIEGTPQQIGLHQALEQWEEHQGCSEEVADLQDKVYDGLQLKQKLESDITVIKERYQKAKSDSKNALQVKVNQLEQANNALREIQVKDLHDQDKTQDYLLHIQKLESDLKASTEQYRRTEASMKVLHEETNQRDRDIEMLDDDVQVKEELESNVKLLQERYQQAESEKGTLQEKTYQLELDLKASQERYQNSEIERGALRVKTDKSKSEVEALQQKTNQLNSDLKSTGEQYQSIKLEKEALQGNIHRLESDLKTTKEQHQLTESEKRELEEKTDQLELDLKALQERHQNSESDMKALREQINQLESDLNITREQSQSVGSEKESLQEKLDQSKSNLEFIKEQNQTAKLDMEALQGKINGLESDLKTTKEQHQMIKSEKEGLQEMVYRLEQDNKTFQEKEDRRLQTEISIKEKLDENGNDKRIQVTPPSSPVYTTDESSKDSEKTPRPKKSLRSDLGYSSREQSDGDHDDIFIAQPQATVMLKQADTSKENMEARAEIWEMNNSDDSEEHMEGSMHRKINKSHLMEWQAKNLRAVKMRAKERAKEQSETLEALFECAPAKASAIDRRLKALGPGCRLYEAPALVAYELSGIPEDTYKGLASGELVATGPPNEVHDIGTSPVIFAADTATDTTDLPTEVVAGPLFPAQDMATDTTDLLVEVTASQTRSRRRALFLYILVSLMILFFSFSLYTSFTSIPGPKTQHGLQYKNIYFHRHTSFPTRSLHASTPVTFVHPPTPAPQYGSVRIMKANSWGVELKGGSW